MEIKCQKYLQVLCVNNLNLAFLWFWWNMTESSPISCAGYHAVQHQRQPDRGDGGQDQRLQHVQPDPPPHQICHEAHNVKKCQERHRLEVRPTFFLKSFQFTNVVLGWLWCLFERSHCSISDCTRWRGTSWRITSEPSRTSWQNREKRRWERLWTFLKTPLLTASGRAAASGSNQSNAKPCWKWRLKLF